MKRLVESLSTTSDGAFIIDDHHRIVFWNQAAEALLGYTAREVAGMPCYEILGGRDAQGWNLCQQYCRVAIQVANGDVLPNRDVFAMTRTGKGCWVNVTTFVYSSADKNADQIIVHMFRDATEQKNNQLFVDRVLAAATEQLQQDDSYRAIPDVSEKPQPDGLTAREQQVLALLAQGLGTNNIASKLVISQTTVRNHVQNILNKLGVHSRLEAIAYAYQQGFIEISKL
jgi:PAS domain S-box-containing protein